MRLRDSLIALSVFGLAAGPLAVSGAAAQDDTQPPATMEAPAATANFDDDTLRSFVVAFLQVDEINRTYLPQMQEADTPEAQQEVQHAGHPGDGSRCRECRGHQRRAVQLDHRDGGRPIRNWPARINELIRGSSRISFPHTNCFDGGPPSGRHQCLDPVCDELHGQRRQDDAQEPRQDRTARFRPKTCRRARNSKEDEERSRRCTAR